MKKSTFKKYHEKVLKGEAPVTAKARAPAATCMVAYDPRTGLTRPARAEDPDNRTYHEKMQTPQSIREAFFF